MKALYTSAFLAIVLCLFSCDEQVPDDFTVPYDNALEVLTVTPEIAELIEMPTTSLELLFDPCANGQPDAFDENNDGVLDHLEWMTGTTTGATGVSETTTDDGGDTDTTASSTGGSDTGFSTGTGTGSSSDTGSTTSTSTTSDGATGSTGTDWGSGVSVTSTTTGTDGGSTGDFGTDGGGTTTDGGDTGESAYFINTSQQELLPGVLTAGETNDLDGWAEWQGLEAEFTWHENTWDLFPRHYVKVRLKDKSENPFIDHPVLLLDAENEVMWVTRTDKNGEAVLWINYTTGEWEEVKLATIAGEDMPTYEINGSEEFNDIVLNEEILPTTRCEIMLAFDATSSMKDEMDYIKIEALDIFDRIRDDNPSIEFSYSSVFYRDYGDQYVSVHTPFTTNEQEVMDFISIQWAAGGGDIPEAVHRGLHNMVVEQDWALGAKSRIAFLFLDASPHFDDCVTERIRLLIKEAARKGIRLLPVASSDAQKVTEFFCRFSALLTDGSYLYLTDHSEIGNDHINPSVGSIEVEFLNDLMVRLINESLQ